MRFELSHDPRNISDEDILADMRRIAEMLGITVLRQREYAEHGKFAVKTAINRFGSWSAAVERAGLTKSVDRQITNMQMFQNLLRIWTGLGRQPRYAEVRKTISNYNVTTYERRFGSWRLALEAFVVWANAEDVQAPHGRANESPAGRRSARQPDLRLRFRVMRRDHFKCCICGMSPALKPGTILEVDHIVPWSKSGETVFENLQTLCQMCNNGKSNLSLGNHHGTELLNYHR